MNENVFSVNSEFVDYLNNTHRFTVAVVVEKDPDLLLVDLQGECDCPVIARVGLGVSVCNTNDDWDTEKGKMIAVGRAKRYLDDSLAITSRAMMNFVTEDSINDMLDKEVAYVKEHPGAFIPGYDEAKAKHDTAQRVAELTSKLSQEEKDFINFQNTHTFSEEYQELVKLTSKN